MRKLLFCLLFVFVWGMAIDPAFLGAAGFRYSTPTPSHQETIISNVTPTLITVTTQTVSSKGKVLAKTSRSFVITKFTEINVNSQRATVADLKPGMKVSVTAGTDASQAARINANG
jgi:hypothetical protein